MLHLRTTTVCCSPTNGSVPNVLWRNMNPLSADKYLCQFSLYWNNQEFTQSLWTDWFTDNLKQITNILKFLIKFSYEMNMKFLFIKGRVDLPTWMKIFKLVEWCSDHQLIIVPVNILSFKQRCDMIWEVKAGKLSNSKGSTGQAWEDVILGTSKWRKRYLSYILPWSLIASSASPWWYSSHLKMCEYYLSLILNCKHHICLVYHQLLSLVQCLAMFADWLTYCSLLHNLAGNKSQPSSYKSCLASSRENFSYRKYSKYLYIARNGEKRTVWTCHKSEATCFYCPLQSLFLKLFSEMPASG